MSCRDLYVILTTCCSPEKKQRIWEEAHKQADQLHAQYYNNVGLASKTVPDQEPDWDYNTQGGNRNKNTMIQCLLAGIKQCLRQPVNYARSET